MKYFTVFFSVYVSLTAFAGTVPHVLTSEEIIDLVMGSKYKSFTDADIDDQNKVHFKFDDLSYICAFKAERKPNSPLPHETVFYARITDCKQSGHDSELTIEREISVERNTGDITQRFFRAILP